MSSTKNTSYADINKHLAANFKELHAAAGKPSQLNDALVKQYSLALKASCDSGDSSSEEQPVTSDGPHASTASFRVDSNRLGAVVLTDKKKEFKVTGVECEL